MRGRRRVQMSVDRTREGYRLHQGKVHPVVWDQIERKRAGVGIKVGGTNGVILWPTHCASPDNAWPQPNAYRTLRPRGINRPNRLHVYFRGHRFSKMTIQIWMISLAVSGKAVPIGISCKLPKELVCAKGGVAWVNNCWSK